MRLICEATNLTEEQAKKLAELLRAIDCEPIEVTENSVLVDYEGEMSRHALAIIALVEGQGCHRVLMTN